MVQPVRAVIAFVLLCACVTTPPPPPPVSGFRIEVEPPDAVLTVDGQSLGPVSAVPLDDGVLKLEPGIHQVSLTLKGYQTWRGEVSLGNKVEPLKINLVKR